MELRSSHNWDIQIEPYIHGTHQYDPPLPSLPGKYATWLPALSYNLTEASMNFDSIQLFADTAIDSPQSRNEASTISIQVAEDADESFYKYKARYFEYMVLRDGRSTPFKHCCSKISVWFYRPDREILLKRVYLGSLTELSLDKEATAEPQAVTIPLTFRLHGYIQSNPQDYRKYYDYPETQPNN